MGRRVAAAVLTIAGAAHAGPATAAELRVRPMVRGDTLRVEVAREVCEPAAAEVDAQSPSDALAQRLVVAGGILAAGLVLAASGDSSANGDQSGAGLGVVGIIGAVIYGGIAVGKYPHDERAYAAAVAARARTDCREAPVGGATAALLGPGGAPLGEGALTGGVVVFPMPAERGRLTLQVRPPGEPPMAVTFELPGAGPAQAVARVAVLELRNTAGLTAEEGLYLADVVRGAAVKALPRARWFVMTRENILAQLPPGTSVAECQGDCEVETGRNIGADLVVSGELLKYGGELRVTLKLHDTRSATLVGSETAAGPDLGALEKDVDRAARAAFAGVAP